jgi:hypothetical protein
MCQANDRGVIVIENSITINGISIRTGKGLGPTLVASAGIYNDFKGTYTLPSK